MSPAENTPNFDTMSPEEIIAWMETLAKRQGASEGITTNANVEIPEIDPSTVVIDEPGYVPYGKDPKKWAEEEAARKASQAVPPQPVSPPAAPAVPAAPPPRAASPVAPPQPLRPAAQMQPPAAPKPPQPAPASAMSWLESLAADQGGDLPELDLSALAAEITPVSSGSPAVKPPAANPIDWLESLTQGQEEETQSAPPVSAAEVADPFAQGVDPMSWLETIARRQGAKHEELTTPANVNVPPPTETPSREGAGYTPYSFDSLGLSSRPAEEAMPSEMAAPEAEEAEAELEDPGAWLDSLAASQSFTPEAVRGARADRPLTDDEIRQALERGEDIPHEAMERWMNRQLEIGAQRDEPEVEYDPDAPAVPAELPDWLIEQVGSSMPPEDFISSSSPQQPALIDVIAEPPPAADIPDWLKDEVPAENDLDNLFDTTPEEAPLPASFAVQPEIDESDPWAEALEYERQHDINDEPDWYVQNISDPTRRAAVDRRLFGEVPEPELEDAALPAETSLPLGQPEEMPDWLQEAAAEESAALSMEVMPNWLQADVGAPAEPAAAVIAEPAADIPDWLKSVDVDEVPDWLKETISPPAAPPAPAPAVVVPPQPVVSQPIVPPAPVPAAPPAPAAQPAVPAMPPAARLDAPVLLTEARGSIGSGDVEGGLSQYEALIRANVELEAVAADLAQLAEKHKANAAIYRVWGDGLMRQGKLQAALDTYRKALNQL